MILFYRFTVTGHDTFPQCQKFDLTTQSKAGVVHFVSELISKLIFRVLHESKEVLPIREKKGKKKKNRGKNKVHDSVSCFFR